MLKRLRATLRVHWGAFVIGGLFLLLSIVYSSAIPAWEADNELSHFNYVRYLVDHQTLPDPNAPVSRPEMIDACRSGEFYILTESTHQYRQPPLYYAIGALATFWIETDSSGPSAANPFRMWDPTQLGYNFALHDPAAEAWPYTGTLLALHSLRLYSGLLGLSGLAATYLLGLLLFAGRRSLALAMMAVNAFIPQYIFASSIVNNDIMVAALSAWCVLLCAYIALRSPRVSLLFLAALLAALALTAKYNAIALLPLVGLTAVVVLRAVQRSNQARIGRVLLAMVFLITVAVIPALVWIVRNQILYDQALGVWGDVVDYVKFLMTGDSARATENAWHAAQFAFATFWGQFGWDTLMLPSWLIAVLAVPVVAAAVGVVVFLVDKRQPRETRAVVLVACLFVTVASVLAYAKTGESFAPRGRYLLPALSVICFLLVLGLYRILPQKIKLAGVTALWVSLLAIAVAVPWLVLRPAYAPPRMEATAELQPGEQPLGATIGGLAELVGYRIEPLSLAAGDPVQVTLVWKAVGTTPNNYTLSIHLLDGDKFPRAWVMSHPGHGNFPTSIWRPGDIFRDTYQLYWADTPWERLPSEATFKVALFCPSATGLKETALDVLDAQGNPLGDAIYFGRARVDDGLREAAQQPTTTPAYTFGDALALESYRLTPDRPEAGQQVSIETRWRALTQPRADYTVFVHLTDSAGQQITGYDQPFTEGYYPSSLWQPGETITHTHRLSLPALLPGGAYQIRLGVYDPQSGQRLSVQDRAQTPLQDNQISLFVIDVPD